MAKVVLLAIVGLGILIPSAHAADWKVNATQNETVEANSNRAMQPQSKGPSYNSVNSLLFDAQALTPTSLFTFNGHLDYRTFGGPGEANVLNSLNNGVNVRFQKTERLTTYNVIASRTERESSTIQLIENGQITSTGTVVSTAAGGGFQHTLSANDTLSSQSVLTQTESSTDTTGATATSGSRVSRFDSLSSTLDLKHRVGPVTEWLPSLQYVQLNYGNAAHTQIQFWKGTTAIDTDINSLLHVKASAGAIVLSGGENAQTSVGPALDTAAPTSKMSMDWIADMALTYRYSKNGTAHFTAAQSSGPTTFGQFSKRDTFSAGLSYRINDESSVSTNISYTQLITASPSDILVSSVTYSHTLMRDLDARWTYRHAERMSKSSTATAAASPATTTSDENVARSDAVVFTLRRHVTVLP